MSEPITKEQAQADVKLFANYISELKHDPNCHRCFGKGYLGFQGVPTKDGWKVQLLTCRCVQVGETEYTRLIARLDQGLGFLHIRVMEELTAIRRRTAFGAFEYLWGKVRGKS